MSYVRSKRPLTGQRNFLDELRGCIDISNFTKNGEAVEGVGKFMVAFLL
jgi:hypothetical protein